MAITSELGKKNTNNEKLTTVYLGSDEMDWGALAMTCNSVLQAGYIILVKAPAKHTLSMYFPCENRP